jgi:hypothetical protein
VGGPADEDDAKYFQSVEVTADTVVVASDGKLIQKGHSPTVTITASSLPSLVSNALASHHPSELQGASVCVISGHRYRSSR